MFETYVTIVNSPFLWIAVGLTIVFYLITWMIGLNLKSPNFSSKQWLHDHYVEVVFWLGLAAICAAAYFYLIDAGRSVASMVDHLLRLTTGSSDEKLNTDAVRNLAQGTALLLGAILAAATIPFTMLRTWINERTATATEQGLITDRINKAVEGLGAEKTVSRVYETPLYKKKNGKWMRDKEGNPIPSLRPDGKPRINREVVQESIPNMEVRIGAIYALERIAQDSDRDHVQIMEILCAYVRQNSPRKNAIESPHEVFERLTLSGRYNENEIPNIAEFRKANPFDWSPADLNSSRLRDWARSLKPISEDIQTVLAVIGRRNKRQKQIEQKIGYQLNLSESNLQSARVTGDFDNCNFNNSRFDNSRLNGQFNGSTFKGCKLTKVEADHVSLDRTDFSETDIKVSEFGYSSFAASRFWLSRCSQTEFNGANFRGADFYGAKLENCRAYFGCDLKGARISAANIIELHGLDNGAIEDKQSFQMWPSPESSEGHEFFVEKKIFLYSELDNRSKWHEWLHSEGIAFFGPDNSGYQSPQ